MMVRSIERYMRSIRDRCVFTPIFYFCVDIYPGRVYIIGVK